MCARPVMKSALHCMAREACAHYHCSPLTFWDAPSSVQISVSWVKILKSEDWQHGQGSVPINTDVLVMLSDVGAGEAEGEGAPQRAG